VSRRISELVRNKPCGLERRHRAARQSPSRAGKSNARAHSVWPQWLSCSRHAVETSPICCSPAQCAQPRDCRAVAIGASSGTTSYAVLIKKLVARSARRGESMAFAWDGRARVGTINPATTCAFRATAAWRDGLFVRSPSIDGLARVHTWVSRSPVGLWVWEVRDRRRSPSLTMRSRMAFKRQRSSEDRRVVVRRCSCATKSQLAIVCLRAPPHVSSLGNCWRLDSGRFDPRKRAHAETESGPWKGNARFDAWLFYEAESKRGSRGCRRGVAECGGQQLHAACRRRMQSTAIVFEIGQKSKWDIRRGSAFLRIAKWFGQCACTRTRTRLHARGSPGGPQVVVVTTRGEKFGLCKDPMGSTSTRPGAAWTTRKCRHRRQRATAQTPRNYGG